MAPLPPPIESYVSSVLAACSRPGSRVVSVILFGSAATGGYSSAISDVDLLIVLDGWATHEDRRRVREEVEGLESRAGLTKQYPYRRGALNDLADRLTANVRSFFVCTREDVLSGDPARILDIPAAQAVFVDRVAIPSIVGSSRTVWGEDLLAKVPLPPIRRFDVAKAFFGLANQVWLTVVAYPVLPGATKYAMEALKRSIHNCYYCYHCCPAQLSHEVAFFQKRIGPSATLAQLMDLRTDYKSSLGFNLRCLPTLVRLHLITAWDNRFPRDPRAVEKAGAIS